jgi:hypothetical protein
MDTRELYMCSVVRDDPIHYSIVCLLLNKLLFCLRCLRACPSTLPAPLPAYLPLPSASLFVA